MRHGLPDMDQRMDIRRHYQKERKKKSDEPDVNISTVFRGRCCFGWFLAKQKSMSILPVGKKPTPKGREVKEEDGELTEFDKEQYKPN